MPSATTRKIPAGIPALVPTGAYAGSPTLPLDRMCSIAGTKEGCHLRLISSTVSQTHAVIITGKEGVYVRDLASRTHVLVNQKPVREQFLNNGDDVQIGRFTFKFAANKAKFTGPTELGAMIAADEGNPSPIKGRVLLIGRRPGSDVLIDNERVSKCHAVIYLCDGQWHVRDLGSRTGTKLNGKVIHKADLNFGDVVRIGGVDLQFAVGTTEDELEHLVGTASLMPEEQAPSAPTPAEEAVKARAPVSVPAAPRQQKKDASPAPAEIHSDSDSAPIPIAIDEPEHREPPLDQIDLAELEVSDPGVTRVLPATADTPTAAPKISDLVVDDDEALHEDAAIPLAAPGEAEAPAVELPQAEGPAPAADEDDALFRTRRGWRMSEAPPLTHGPQAGSPAEIEPSALPDPEEAPLAHEEDESAITPGSKETAASVSDGIAARAESSVVEDLEFLAEPVAEDALAKPAIRPESTATTA
ncbi:MAG TPA: FHA domain-containing protein, partial [Tepidisphaeraceae bacterium]|nr:FHA domain-containing protein [Tepidisphaeraceae bacterium]